MEKKGNDLNDPLPIKSLLVLFSYHHQNTKKIAEVFAKVLDAQIKSPLEIKSEDLRDYDLIGFGSGIYNGKHHEILLELADKLPPVKGKNAFIFSTSGLSMMSRVFNARKFHDVLREKLQSKGYMIIDEFNCKGLDTNSFLKYIGGLNKGRPNAEDLKHAEKFIQNLKQKTHPNNN